VDRGQISETAREWDQATEIYKSLWMVFPDNIDYGLHLATAQLKAGRSKDALNTIVQLRQATSFGDDPRIDLAQAAVAEELGDFQQEETAATRAEELANASGARILAANALLRQCWALNNRGDRKRALDAAQKARQIFAATGDRGGEARSLKNIADALDDEGKHADGEKYYQAALTMFRRIGDQGGVAVTLNNLGHALRNQGDLRSARTKFEASLNTSRRIGDGAREALALNGLAIVM
jgi:eukaryotic-like serine/threonine-protein kinase